MKILALEFSSARRGVAVLDGATVLGLAEAEGLVPGAFALIEVALRGAKLEREAIECIAVGLGPGSYTGIRSAIALAQGWQFASGVKLLGVSSAEVLASTARAAGATGRVAVVVDALRGEFYSASYEITADGWRETAPLRLLKREDIEVLAAGGEAVVNPDASCPFAGVKLLRPSAGELGRLASARIDFQSGEKLEPIYLRETNFAKAPPARFY